MAMHKYGCLTEHEPQAEDFLYQLGDAAVRIDLLRVKPSHTVTLSLDAVVDGVMETNNRGMIVCVCVYIYIYIYIGLMKNIASISITFVLIRIF